MPADAVGVVMNDLLRRQKRRPPLIVTVRGAPISPMNPDGAKLGYGNASGMYSRVEGVADHQLANQEPASGAQPEIDQRELVLAERRSSSVYLNDP